MHPTPQIFQPVSITRFTTLKNIFQHKLVFIYIKFALRKDSFYIHYLLGISFTYNSRNYLARSLSSNPFPCNKLNNPVLVENISYRGTEAGETAVT